MIKNSKVIGEPLVDFTGTWDEIKAILNPVKGMTAYDTTNDLFVGYNGSWKVLGIGHIIQNDGTSAPQRTNLNFTGSGVSISDESGDDATKITITGGGEGGGADILEVQVFS